MSRSKTTSRGRGGGPLRALKWLVPLLVVIGLVGLAFLPKAVEVDVGVVSSGPMLLTVDDDGETRVTERYTVSAPIAGRLLRVVLDPGDPVARGDVLATLDPGAPNLLDPRARAQAEALAKAAEAAVGQAQKALDGRVVEAGQLEAAYRRDQELHAKGNIADAAFERAEAAYLAAKHSREAAQSAVQIARFELEQANAALLRFSDNPPADEDWNLVIHSPIDGRVLRVHEESSRMVQAGTPVLEVGDPASLEMRIDVLSQDAVLVQPGQKIIVEHWGGASELSGRVRLIEPSAYTKVSALGVDEQRVDVIGDFESPAQGIQSLGDRYRIEARIIVWESADALRLPAGALFRDAGGWAVYRIDGERARLSRVDIGRNNGEVAEVLSGLDDGDKIILHPGDRIADGTQIRPRS